MNEWHDAKKELPPIGKPVIVESEHGYQTICWIVEEGTWAGNLKPLRWAYRKEKKL